ncbi:PREDICTED: uncharacterized protein LOC108750213, partial [Trachymyrmex septentrionalis]|uniref:uncharacterized protein LOC108750213 n=1 Tax=Trachymyrmex septentrionalis TaxID=34720 RepID=UPI00084F591D
MLLHTLWFFIQFIHMYIKISDIFRYRDQAWTFEYTLDGLYDISNFIVHSIIFIILNYICQTVYYKINETVVILHKLSNYNRDEVLRRLILQFIFQIKLKKVKFGVGYFYYGYNFIYQLHIAVLDYLIFILSVRNLYETMLQEKFI